MIRKRRRNSTTNYSKRIAMLKGGLPRIVVRRSNRGILMQVVEYSESGDKVLISANSSELTEYAWQPRGNMPTAYLTGCLLARKARDLKQPEYILDIGLVKPIKSSVVFAAAKGSIDSGLKMRNTIEVDQKRIAGGHISEHAAKLHTDGAKYKRQFSKYIEVGFAPENIAQAFEQAKKKISGA
jgi:large subunit ribosomal protein L18